MMRLDSRDGGSGTAVERVKNHVVRTYGLLTHSGRVTPR